MSVFLSDWDMNVLQALTLEHNRDFILVQEDCILVLHARLTLCTEDSSEVQTIASFMPRLKHSFLGTNIDCGYTHGRTKTVAVALP